MPFAESRRLFKVVTKAIYTTVFKLKVCLINSQSTAFATKSCTAIYFPNTSPNALQGEAMEWCCVHWGPSFNNKRG